jgi:glutamate carboxypeptidase
MDTLQAYLRNELNRMLAMLRVFVEAESPSTEKAAVDRFGNMVAQTAAALGGRVHKQRSRQTGEHLHVGFGFGTPQNKRQILLLGHLDTVWPLGTIRRLPFRIQKGRAYGPGVFDMKSGIVSALFAIEALRKQNIQVRRNIVLLLTADEEVGSIAARPIVEKEAKRSDLVLVLEPAHGLHGALKTSRKGVGEFEIRVKGKAAHAGLEPEKGASAVAELCRQILRVQKFSDPRRGITVNAGVISGGTRSNVVAADALAKVDVRISRLKDMRNIEKRLRSLQPLDRRTSVKVSGQFNRPPLERTAEIIGLFQRARRVAETLGIRLTEVAVGGASDGNFTGALGVPTLDGLGCVGEGAHADHENIVVRELPRRSALLAHLIAEFGNAP